MNVVLIIPTGIGAEIGGHAGDGNPAAKLIASCCDTLITHPNVVNASDINEMTENTLYVEGSMLDRFLDGSINLKRVHYNKILVVTNPPLKNEVVNSVSAARATIGADISIEVLKTPLVMIADIKNYQATGIITGAGDLIDQVRGRNFDALAITSEINIDRDIRDNYFKNGGINPWGGVEAKLSKIVSTALDKPVAHSPIEPPEMKTFNEIVDPRMSAEIVSVSYLHCVLKGLHKAPRISKEGLSYKDIDFLISPMSCYGRPHEACIRNNIPVIAVEENLSEQIKIMHSDFIIVDNYLEAAGYIMSMKAGVHPASVRRPLEKTKIYGGK